MLGVVEDAFVQIALVHVQRLTLPLHRLNHMGMRVANARHVVVEVEVAPTVSVVEPDAFTSDDVDRIVVERRDASAEQSLPTRKQIVSRWCAHVWIVHFASTVASIDA